MAIPSRRFADLRIRTKLLLSYSAVFLLSLTIGSVIIFLFVKQTIQANIESELKNTTQTILNMVRTSASVSMAASCPSSSARPVIRTSWTSTAT